MSNLFKAMREQNRTKELHKAAIASAFAYMDGVDERPVGARSADVDALAVFDEPFPETTGDGMAIIEQLARLGGPATSAMGGGRYFGFVNGGVIPASMAARLLADIWDQNAALNVIAPIASKCEQVVEGWMADAMGLPEGTAAGFVSGTSTATMCGLIAGRNALLKQHGWDVIEDGIFGAPPIRVVMSKQGHGTVRKVLTMIGIGRNNIEWVDFDDQGRIDPAAMPQLDDRTLLILQAGNVNTGSFDAFREICTKAQAAGAWTHIDGAFGLWAAACKQVAHLCDGIELADSWSVDGHKTLNSPYDSGIVLCKDRQALVSAMSASGAYIQWSNARDGMMYTPEMSRRARGVDLWALMKYLGRDGIDALIGRLVDMAQLFGRELSARGFRVLNDVVFNQVLVACDSAEQTQQTLANIQAGGECWCGGSIWNGEPVIRISVCSWVTTEDDVMRSVRAFVAARDGD